jgi:hypothetical protein
LLYSVVVEPEHGYDGAALYTDVEGFHGILFCGIQKLQSIRQGQPDLFAQIVRDARLIVFDEAHKAAATETRQLVEDFMILPPGYEDRALLGLTATPGRSTLTGDENKVLSDMFENKLIGIDVNIVNQVNMSQTAYLNHTSETNAIRISPLPIFLFPSLYTMERKKVFISFIGSAEQEKNRWKFHRFDYFAYSSTIACISSNFLIISLASTK